MLAKESTPQGSLEGSAAAPFKADSYPGEKTILKETAKHCGFPESPGKTGKLASRKGSTEPFSHLVKRHSHFQRTFSRFARLLPFIAETL